MHLLYVGWGKRFLSCGSSRLRGWQLYLSRDTHTHKVPALSQVPAEAVEEHPTGSGMQQEVPVTDPELLQWNSTLGIFKRSVIILFRNKSSAFA